MSRTRLRSLGISLVELLVASMVAGLIMIEIWMLVRTGGQFHKKAKGQSEIQRNSLLALRWMAKDLSEGSALSFRQFSREDTEGKPTGIIHEGIVFGSPGIPGDNKVEYDGNGRMLWSSMIAYYIEPTDGCLYRQQVPLLGPKKTFPPVIDNSRDSTDILAAQPRPRLVARGVKTIESTQGPTDVQIKLNTIDEKLGFGIEVKTRLEMKN